MFIEHVIVKESSLVSNTDPYILETVYVHNYNRNDLIIIRDIHSEGRLNNNYKRLDQLPMKLLG